MDKQKGAIIYLDGPDGVGKTTQLQLLVEALQARGQTVFVTRTMGGTPIGELLRAAALSSNKRPVETDLHIVLACQYALLSEVLERRERGEVVLIDRSPLSIIAYQVFGDGLDGRTGYAAAKEFLNQVKPDLTILYTAPEESLAERREQRDHAQKHDYFEDKPSDYHARVAAGYLEAAKELGAEVIDATLDANEVHAATIALILPIVNNN